MKSCIKTTRMKDCGNGLICVMRSGSEAHDEIFGTGVQRGLGLDEIANARTRVSELEGKQPVVKRITHAILIIIETDLNLRKEQEWKQRKEKDKHVQQERLMTVQQEKRLKGTGLLVCKILRIQLEGNYYIPESHMKTAYDLAMKYYNAPNRAMSGSQGAIALNNFMNTAKQPSGGPFTFSKIFRTRSLCCNSCANGEYVLSQSCIS